MIDKIKIMVALVAAAIVIGGGGGLNSCTVEPSVESPSEKPAEYLPDGMPSEVAVYGPIISLDGDTRVIKYTVKADFPEGGTTGLEYKTTAGTNVGTFTADFVIEKAPAQSIEALILQYGTASDGNGFSPNGLFVNRNNGIKELDPAVSGGSYALNASGFVIIPLDTEEIKKQLTIVLSPASPQTTWTQTTPIIWIEDNQNGIGEVESINTPLWGAGAYVSNGIRIGGLSTGGSIDTTGGSASTVDNFDTGATAEKNQPRSIATVLVEGDSSTINFYDAAGATGLIGTDTDPVPFSGGSVSGGSLGLESGDAVRNWMEKGGAPKPAVRVIYEWKKQE